MKTTHPSPLPPIPAPNPIVLAPPSRDLRETVARALAAPVVSVIRLNPNPNKP